MIDKVISVKELKDWASKNWVMYVELNNKQHLIVKDLLDFINSKAFLYPDLIKGYCKDCKCCKEQNSYNTNPLFLCIKDSGAVKQTVKPDGYCSEFEPRGDK